MSEENRRDDPGVSPEAQRQEITRRGHATHPAGERSRVLNRTRPGDKLQRPEKARAGGKRARGAS